MLLLIHVLFMTPKYHVELLSISVTLTTYDQVFKQFCSVLRGIVAGKICRYAPGMLAVRGVADDLAHGGMDLGGGWVLLSQVDARAEWSGAGQNAQLPNQW